MSASSAPAISFAENRTFRDFVLLYAGMSVLILLLLGAIYYRYQKEVMLSEHRLAMQLQSESYVPRLKRWMQGDDPRFPVDLAYRTALFGAEHRVIHSRLKRDDVLWKASIALNGDQVQFVIPLASYELGENYLVFETDDDGLWLRRTLMNVALFGVPLFGVLVLIGWHLSSLFLRPMRDSIALLDRFIKDTTHELNTPVSAILTNVETIEEDTVDEAVRKKLMRIDIAARTISTIYDDLTYLVFHRRLQFRDERLDLAALCRERMEYFRHKCEQKKLNVSLNTDEHVFITADRTKLTRVVDNLLGNAVKYTRPGGSIDIRLSPGMLLFEDTGVGIPAEKLETITRRYVRADTAEGGFGIGLSIVASIAREYGWELSIDSTEGEGSRFAIRWDQSQR